MGKNLFIYNAGDQFEDDHPGFMWRTIRALGYHRCHYNLRKMLPRRRHKQMKDAKRNPKSMLSARYAYEVQKLLDTEASDFLANPITTGTSSTGKSSPNARIKALVAEEISMEDDEELCQLESSEKGYSKLQHRKRFDVCGTQNSMNYLEHGKLSQSRSFSQENCNKEKEDVDVLELFQVNKVLFQEFQQNTYAGKKTCFQMPQASNTKAKLTKSGSFPVADLSYSYKRNFKPSKIMHKQTEIWSLPREEKLRVGAQAPDASKYQGRPCQKFALLTADTSGSRLLDKVVSFRELSTAVSVHESSFLLEITSLSTSEGLECKNSYPDEESPLDLLNSMDKGFDLQSCSTTYSENLENPNESNESVKNLSNIKLHINDDAELNYVRQLLDRSGFNEKGFHGAWYSSDQRLSPLLFNEMEESCQQLLFDLVNEKILLIYKRLFTYYPKAFSSSSRVNPISGRYHDEDFLKIISQSLGLQLERPVDDPVTQDLAEDDGWMNLQMEPERVALELEYLILDELIEEVTCS